MMKPAAILFLAALAATGPALGAERYSIVTAAYPGDAANNAVVDARTGLTWRRCSEGQAWSGSACTGAAGGYSHEEALSQAKAQTGWRLPNVKELASLADRSRSGPAIDPTAFPGTPSTWYWTSSPYVSAGYNTWGVNFDYGGVYGYGRVFSHQVRLVHASQ